MLSQHAHNTDTRPEGYATWCFRVVVHCHSSYNSGNYFVILELAQKLDTISKVMQPESV